MIGRTLSHYRITSQLGAGAEDARLGRQVALKFVSSDLAHDSQAVMRLRSEAKAASALNHPNICTIYDIGEDNGHPFIVMELMKGQTLRERLNQGPVKVTQLVDIGVEIADALHAAHSEGIIHRDIKPGNIFLTERGLVKILDFGLAKLSPTLTTSTTSVPTHPSVTGVTHGTPAYMSPEQATGEHLDHRTDLFSLGVVLYECATGHHPFPGKTPAVVLAGILDRAAASPLVHNADLPPRLVEIISNCLEKDRELRYQSAADLRADLKRLRRDLESGGVRAADPRGPVVSTQGTSPTALGNAAHNTPIDASPAPTPAAPGRSRLMWIGSTAVVVVVMVAAAVVMWMRPSEPQPQPLTSSAPPVATPATPDAIPTDRQMALATASLNAGNYRAALTSAREVLALNPNHEGAVRIRDQATAMLSRFDNEIADARRRLNSGDLEDAARAIERARSIDASSPSIAELSARLGEGYRTRERASRPASRDVTPDATRSAVPPAPSAPGGPVSATPLPAVEKPALPPPPAGEVPAAAPTRAPEPPKPEPAAPAVNESPATSVSERPTPPSAINSETDTAAIRQVIANYGRAIESKDIRLFRSIKPNLTAEEERRLQEGFRAVTSQRVSLTIISMDRKGDQASALIRRQDEIVAGGRSQKTDTQQAVTLTRTASGWVITEIR
jgi:serine/threonine protein kinase